MDVPAALPPALACLVGYFGYETIGLVEDLPRPAADPLGLPDMMFVRPTVILIFDRLSDALLPVTPVWPDTARDLDALIAPARDRTEPPPPRHAATALPTPDSPVAPGPAP